MEQIDKEARLVRQVADGNEKSLGRLYDLLSELCFSIAIDVLGDRQEAEDLVHDVFIEVWNRADQFDPERGSVRTWISVITRSRCIDRTRLSRWKNRETSEEIDGSEFPAENSSKRPGRRADDYKIRRRIERLPDDQRDVVILAYFGGFSSSEIASRLSIPIGTVKSRMRLAMSKFREAFDVK
jgi:RNA polymerase sigma-70 factor (ECF subfamily)